VTATAVLKGPGVAAVWLAGPALKPKITMLPMAIRDSIFDGILQMQVMSFFRELLSPNFVHFLLGFTEAKACVEMRCRIFHLTFIC
jgi:hypothetical protein